MYPPPSSHLWAYPTYSQVCSVGINICSDLLDAAFMPQGPQNMCGLTSYDMLMMLRECGKAGATGFDFVEIYPDAYSLQTASHVGCWFALYTLNGIAERKANENK